MICDYLNGDCEMIIFTQKNWSKVMNFVTIVLIIYFSAAISHQFSCISLFNRLFGDVSLMEHCR